MNRARRYWLVIGWLGAIAMPFAGLLLWLPGYSHRQAKEAALLFHQNYDATAKNEEKLTDDQWAWRFRGRAGLGELSALAKDPALSPRGRRIAVEIQDYILGGEHLESGRRGLATTNTQAVLEQPVEVACDYYSLLHDSRYPAKPVPLVRHRLLDLEHQFELINVTPCEKANPGTLQFFAQPEITSTRLANGDVQFKILAPLNFTGRPWGFVTDLAVNHITYQADGEVATELNNGLRDLPSDQDEKAVRCTFTTTAKELQEPNLAFRMTTSLDFPRWREVIVLTYYIQLGKFVPKELGARSHEP